MKQTSNTQNNDLLNRLRENVASQNATEETSQETSEKNGLTPEQLLEQLRMQMGERLPSPSEDEIAENDYDISGYEIEEQTTSETVDAPAIIDVVEEADVPDSDEPSQIPDETAPDEADNDVPWETEPEEDAETAEVETAAVSEQKEEVCVAETIVPDEFDVSFEESEDDQNEDALKRQIELFVEKTINPDEVFDYFEGLDKKATRERQAAEKITADTNAEPDVAAIANDSILDAKIEYPAIALQQEELTEEEICMSSTAGRFFFGSGAPPVEQEDNEDAPATIDDTDINLLLALGQKHSLEQTLGFARVREAKNNFYDPADEESLRNHVFAYNGEEFRSPEQAEEIKLRYRKEKKTLWMRLVGTVILGIIALLVDYLHGASIANFSLGDFLHVNTNYQVISLALLLGGMLISSKRLLDGIRGFFTLRANRFTPLAMIALACVLYNIAALLFFEEKISSLYSFALLALLALSFIGDAIRLTKETLTFDVVSSPKEKYALEKADPSPEMSREEKILSKRDLLVEKVSFVGKYFTRTARRSAAYTEYFIEYLISLVVASFAAIGAGAIQKELASALNAFVVTLLIIMPMQHLIGSYPFGRLAKLLYRHESAVIGEAVDREYVGANTIYLDDTEVFGLHGVSVSGLRTYNEANFYEVLYHAFAVFSRIEGPLQHVFDNSAQEIEAAQAVELIKIHSNGIEALVDEKTNVVIGNAVFMKSKGFKTKQTEDDDRRVENGEISILYIAVDGTLCAKFYMKYNITKRFEAFVNEMHESNTAIGIRTLDPGVSEEMIALLRKDKETTISVIRPTINDLVPIGRRSDSSIITAKNSHMIARILALCSRVKRVNRICSLLRIGAMALSLVATCILLFTGLLTRVPSALIVIYHLLWLLPSSIYTATKLK